MSKMTKRQYAIATAKIIGGLFVLGFGVDSFQTAPDNTLVYVVNETKNFYPATSEYLESIKYQGYSISETITIKDARKKKIWMNKEAQNAGEFIQENRSLSGALLEKINILPPLVSRWNEDGTWKY